MKTAETSLMLPNGRTRSPFRYERCCDVYQISPGGATGTKPPSVILKHLSVIPAKAGIQVGRGGENTAVAPLHLPWIPAFAGMTMRVAASFP